MYAIAYLDAQPRTLIYIHIYYICLPEQKYYISYGYDNVIYIYWDIFNLLDAQFHNELENEDSDKHFCLII